MLDKLKKKIKILINNFLAHFSRYNQILENIFHIIFNDIVKHKKITHFLGIQFS